MNNTCNALAHINYKTQAFEPKNLEALYPLIDAHVEKFVPLHADFSYADPEQWCAVPFDEGIITAVTEAITASKDLALTDIYVVGIGGSSQGAKALWEALYAGRTHTRIHFWETIDPLSVHEYITSFTTHVSEPSFSPYLVCISKSGKTHETSFLVEIALNYMRKQCSSVTDRVAFITQKDSPFHEYAQKNVFRVLFIPATLSGRFSVFSAVGLLPLGLAGVPLPLVRLGAQQGIAGVLQKELVYQEWRTFCAALIYAYQQRNHIAVLDFFVSQPSLLAVGNFLKQLFGESLGKKGKGLYPTVSVMTQDLHAIAQLYLDGATAHMTNFIYGDASGGIPALETLGHDLCTEALCSESLVNQHRRVVDAMVKAYGEIALPYSFVECGALSPRMVAMLMSQYMMTCAVVGSVLNISTYDQPGVELYKKMMS